MKISKLLSIILGLSGFLRAGVVEGDGGGLSLHDAMSSLTGTQADDEEALAPGGEEETDEQLAERLAAEEAEGATQAGGEEEPKQTQTDSDTITIEVDGKNVDLKKSDLPELYKGGLRQQDYTQKTMAAAEQAKTAAAEVAKARAEREEYATKLKNFAITTQSIMEEQSKVLTQELLDQDPTEYLRQQHTFNQRQVELDKANKEMERLYAEHQAEQQTEAKNYMQSQKDALVAAYPDLKDDAKGKEFFTGIENYMTKAGFVPADGRMLFDARVIKMADHAMKYEALMAKVKESKSKVAAAPVKVERPGVTKAPVTDGRTQGMKRLKETGNMHDAAALLMR